MRSVRYLALVVGTAVSLNACAPAGPPPVDAAAADAALKAATSTWMEAYNAAEVDKMVALYEDEAVLMPPHAAVARGHAAIQSFLNAETSGAKAAGVKIVNGTSTTGVVGDTGWESENYTVTDASGATVDSGSYLSVSHRVNGKWLYHRDTWNSDQPLPAPAPAQPEKK